MDSGEDPVTIGLLGSLVTVVELNYPYLLGTTLRVEDSAACALGGTAEQQRLAREIRAVLELVDGLEEEHPMRQQYKVALRSRHPRAPARAAVLPQSHRRTPALPPELCSRVFQLLSTTDSAKAPSLFGCLRLVNHAIKMLVERAQPAWLTLVASACADHFVVGGIEAAEEFRTYLRYPAALSQAAELRVRHVVGPGPLNVLLPVAKKLKRLFIFGTGGAVNLNRLRVKPLRLERLEIHLSTSNWAAVAQLALSNLRALRSLRIHRTGSRVESAVTVQRGFWPPSPLRTIDLSGTRVGPGIVASLAAVLDQGLEELDLSNCDLRVGDTRPAEVVQWPAHRLRKLVLAGNRLRDEDIVGLGIGRCFSLRHLDLSGNQMSRLASIGESPTLVFVDLGSNIIASVDGFRLSSYSRLNRLVLKANMHLGDEGVALIDFGTNPVLEVLDLSRTGMLAASSLRLGENAYVRQLQLRRSQLRSLDFDLGSNLRLASLDLTNSARACTLPNLEALSAQLSGQSTLKTLILVRCGLDDPRISALKLAANTGLERIDVAGNDISVVGLRAMLEENGTMKRVWAGESLVTADDVGEFASRTIEVSLLGELPSGW